MRLDPKGTADSRALLGLHSRRSTVTPYRHAIIVQLPPIAIGHTC